MKNSNNEIEKKKKRRLSLTQWTLLFVSLSAGFFIALFFSNLSLPKLFLPPSLRINIYLSILTLISIIFIILFSIRLKKLKYRISFWEVCEFICLFSLYASLRFVFPSSKWNFFPVFECVSFSYLDIIVIILFISFLALVIRTYCLKKVDSKEHNNIFLEDNPIKIEEQQDDSPYNHLISKIKPALFTDVYESSFSIGVIGPWGTGKTSFLKAVKHAVCDATIDELKVKYNVKKKQDTIFIEFFPFLNHNEKRVIHEFFTQLSNELGERSGRLSNLITVYSEKLANIGNKNPWFSIFQLVKNSRENRSAKDLYDKIEECIRDLNLKIIVTVDDLDRLNAKEILQVLKLIRNTSNFPNMVFLVAMDKEYVMRTLGAKNQYRYRDYIDKFFQVELIIKPPAYQDIVNKMLEDVKLSGQISTDGYAQLENAISSTKETSLNSIFRNYRIATKMINQSIIDNISIPNIFIEIKVEDYLKFMFIEMNYPKFYDKLIKEPNQFLDRKNDCYQLIERKTENKNMSSAEISKQISEMSLFEIPEDDIFYDFENVDFGQVLENTSESPILTKEDSNLIKKILYEIFELTDSNPNSIRIVNNFNKLIRLKIDEKELSASTFSDILKGVVNCKIQKDYDKIIDDNNLIFKSNNLIKKLESYSSKDEKEYIGMLSLQLILLSKHDSKKKDNVYNTIQSSIERFLKLEETDPLPEIVSLSSFDELRIEIESIKEVINDFLINNKEFGNSNKLELLLNLKSISTITWDKDELEKNMLSIFSNYLSDHIKKEWDISNYEFFSFVRLLMDKISSKEIHKIVKEHFNKAPIQNFCIQLVDSTIFSSRYIYGISEVVPLIFGSYFDFYELLDKRINIDYSENTDIRKFLHVLKFYTIGQEENNVNILIVEKFEKWEVENTNRKAENRGQIIIELFDSEIMNLCKNNGSQEIFNKIGNLDSHILKSEVFNANYLIINSYSFNEMHFRIINDFMNKILIEMGLIQGDDSIELKDNLTLIKDDVEILKVISIRPN